MNKNANARSLVLLTVLGAVVIIAIAWFLLISPVLSTAAEASDQAEQQESTNENTQVQVNKLRQQYANIEEYQTELAGLQVQIPTEPGYADLQRLFSQVAERHNVVITSLEFGSAGALEATVETQKDDADESAVTTDPDAEPSAAPTAESGGAQASTGGLYGIPIKLSVIGQYDDVMDTLKELQTMDGRIVLVNGVSLTKSTGRGSATEVTGADTNGVFSGQVFVLTSSTPDEAKPEDSDTSASPSPTPAP